MRESMTNTFHERMMFKWNITNEVVAAEGSTITVTGDVTSDIVNGQNIKLHSLCSEVIVVIANAPTFDSSTNVSSLNVTSPLLLKQYTHIEIDRVQGVVIHH